MVIPIEWHHAGFAEACEELRSWSDKDFRAFLAMIAADMKVSTNRISTGNLHVNQLLTAASFGYELHRRIAATREAKGQTTA